MRLRLALVVLLLGAFALRVLAVRFGLPALNDPDELMFQMGAVRLLSQHTLNPGWFGHPATTTIYLLTVIDVLVFATGWLFGLFPSPAAFATAIYGDPSWVILPGRLAMVCFAVWCVWLTYRLASELFDRRTGLVAAALLAVNPLHVAYSQVIRSDIMATCFLLLCMLAAVRIARDGQRRDTIKASLWMALAVITKWPFALVSLAVLGASVMRMQDRPAERVAELRRLMLFGLLAIGFAVLFSPYMVLDWPTLARNLQGEAQLHHLGATGGTAFENFWWYVTVPVLGSLGAAGALAVAWGLGLLARRREALVVIGPVLGGFFLAVSVQTLIWERWVLPLLPLMAIAGGLATVWLWDFLRARLTATMTGRGLFTVIVIVAMLLPAVVQVFGNARVRLNDTRQMATRWANGRIPAGSTVMIEHFGFDLVSEPWHILFPLGDLGCVDAKAMLAGKIQYSKIDAGRKQRSNVDYGTLNPAVRHTCRADWAILSQYDRYSAERDLFPTEFGGYADLLAGAEIVATFVPEPGRSSGPIIRVVRFR